MHTQREIIRETESQEPSGLQDGTAHASAFVLFLLETDPTKGPKLAVLSPHALACAVVGSTRT